MVSFSQAAPSVGVRKASVGGGAANLFRMGGRRLGRAMEAGAAWGVGKLLHGGSYLPVGSRAIGLRRSARMGGGEKLGMRSSFGAKLVSDRCRDSAAPNAYAECVTRR